DRRRTGAGRARVARVAAGRDAARAADGADARAVAACSAATATAVQVVRGDRVAGRGGRSGAVAAAATVAAGDHADTALGDRPWRTPCATLAAAAEQPFGGSTADLGAEAGVTTALPGETVGRGTVTACADADLDGLEAAVG